MSVGERIRKLRKELDMTQQKFGERIGIKGNTVAQYELGRNEPVDAVFSLICREFNVNEMWLRTGDGEMFRASPSDVLDQLAHKYNLSNADYIIIEKFVHLRPETRKAIFDYIHEVDVAFQDGESNTYSPAYSGNENPFPMDSMINRVREKNAESTTEELEELYKKSRSDSVRYTGLSASSTTGDTERKNAKASNQ